MCGYSRLCGCKVLALNSFLFIVPSNIKFSYLQLTTSSKSFPRHSIIICFKQVTMNAHWIILIKRFQFSVSIFYWSKIYQPFPFSARFNIVPKAITFPFLPLFSRLDNKPLLYEWNDPSLCLFVRQKKITWNWKTTAAGIKTTLSYLEAWNLKMVIHF